MVSVWCEVIDCTHNLKGRCDCETIRIKNLGHYCEQYSFEEVVEDG